MSDPQPHGEALKKQKMSKADWLQVKARAESGESYDSIAALFPIGTSAIVKKAVLEKWVTPRRLAKGMRGELSANDPAAASAAIWKERKEKSREMTYQGAQKSLERFFAMAPVPQTFGEAAIALKMRDQAIDPDAGKESGNGSVNLAILTSVGFTPRVSED